MPRVIGVVGSPRKEQGLTDKLVGEVLAGAAAKGCATHKVQLADLDLVPCVACGESCFQTGVCRNDAAATTLSSLVDRFDALVIGAPVYTWRPNSLTSIFQDKLRLSSGSLITGSRPGKPAVGISVAGGTGSGIMGATQSLYRWLAVWAYRPLPPILATRYNIGQAVEESRTAGEQLASAIETTQPFEDIAECLLHYDSLPYLRDGYVDEFFWLARQIAANLPADLQDDRISRLREGLTAADAALARGERAEAARLVAPAYLAGREAWLELIG